MTHQKRTLHSPKTAYSPLGVPNCHGPTTTLVESLRVGAHARMVVAQEKRYASRRAHEPRLELTSSTPHAAPMDWVHRRHLRGDESE